MEIGIGDYVTLVNDETYVTGEVTGWHTVGGELISIRIAKITEPFLIGEWMIEKEDDND